jgi:hypothetical protein
MQSALSGVIQQGTISLKTKDVGGSIAPVGVYTIAYETVAGIDGAISPGKGNDIEDWITITINTNAETAGTFGTVKLFDTNGMHACSDCSTTSAFGQVMIGDTTCDMLQPWYSALCQTPYQMLAVRMELYNNDGTGTQLPLPALNWSRRNIDRAGPAHVIKPSMYRDYTNQQVAGLSHVDIPLDTEQGRICANTQWKINMPAKATLTLHFKVGGRAKY